MKGGKPRNPSIENETNELRLLMVVNQLQCLFNNISISTLKADLATVDAERATEGAASGRILSMYR